MMKKLFLFSVATLLLWAGSVNTYAATGQFQASNWMAGCKTSRITKGRLCQMSQAVRKAGSKAPLVVVAIQRDIKGKGYMLVLRLPHGLNLPAGVQLQIDRQKARRLAILSSDRGGTFTRVSLSGKVLGTLKNGKALKVSFVTLSGKRFDIPVSLKGFTAALGKLSRLR